MNEVAQLLFDRLSLRLAGTFLAGFFNEVFHTIAKKASDPAAAPVLVFGVVFAPQECLHHLAGVVGAVIEVNDLGGAAKFTHAHVLQAGGSVYEQNDFSRLAKATPDRLLSQDGAKVLQRAQLGNIGGGFIVAHRAALFIPLMWVKTHPR